MDNEEMVGLMAWLGSAADDLTAGDIETIAEEVREIDARYPRPDFAHENDELQRMISALPDDVTVSGYFERIGEESPDMERLYAVGREVVSVKPMITWPDPTAA